MYNKRNPISATAFKTFSAFLSLLCLQQIAHADYYSTIADGNWNNPAVWDNGAVPPNPIPSDDLVEVFNNVTLNVSRTNQGTLYLSSNSLFTINGGVTLTNSGSLDNQNLITNNGSLINNGSIISFRLINGATVTNNSGASSQIMTELENNGTVNNSGTIENFGTFTNNSMVTNNSSFDNYSTVANNSTFNNNLGATFRTSSELSIGNVGTFTNSGTFTYEGGLLLYNGTFATSAGTMQYASNDPQSVLPLTYGVLDISGINSTELLGNVVVNTQLILGCDVVLRLGDKTLTMQSGATVSRCTDGSLSHLRTDEGGSLKRMNVGSNVLFPVGTANSYNPVTLTNTNNDNFTVSVKASFDVAPNDPTVCLTRQWTITEDTPGGNPTAVTLQFNQSDERGVLFSPANPTMYIGRRPVGGPWLSTLATKGSLGVNGPYTVTASFSAFSPFSVTTDASALPVQLASFTGARLTATSVRLNWRTVSEINNYGFYLERRGNGVMEWRSVENSFIAGHGTTNVPQEYSFIDNSALAVSSEYRLKQVDLDGTINYSEPIAVASPTSVTKQEEVPTEFSLKQNYPNPFNPTTTIEYDIADESNVTLAIYNTLGEEVATLVHERLSAGRYQATWNATNIASGIYFYRLSTFDKANKPIVLMRKLIVVK